MSSTATVMIEMIRELHAALIDAHEVDEYGYCYTCYEVECGDAALIARARSFLRAADKEMASRTPTTLQGLRRYDALPPAEAVVQAWTSPGPRPDWHHACVAEVRAAMPLLARALDRLVADQS